MKNFLKNLMSVDENKNSILVWVFVAFALMGLWKCFKFGDVPTNLLGLIEFLVGAIGAINISKGFTKTSAPQEPTITDSDKGDNHGI